MMKSLRLLLTLDCNRACEYCCNKLPETQKRITLARLDDIDFRRYGDVCITGGEPLLVADLLSDAVLRVPRGRRVFIYTNGTNLTAEWLNLFETWNVTGVNVGLHGRLVEHLLDIDRIQGAVMFSNFTGQIRYSANQMYAQCLNWYAEIPPSGFKFWKVNDCNNPNEELVLLEESQPRFSISAGEGVNQ